MPNCNMGLLWERFCLLYDLYSDSLRSSRRKGKGKGIGRKRKNAPAAQAIYDHYGAAQETRTKFLPQNSVTVVRNSKQYRYNLERSFEMDGCKSGKEAPRILFKTPRGPVNRQEGRLGTRKMQP